MQHRSRILIGMYTFTGSAVIGLIAILLRSPIPVAPALLGLRLRVTVCLARLLTN